MAELADAGDLKSPARNRACGFESRLGQFLWFDRTGILAEKKIEAVLFDIGETLLNFGRVDVVSLFKQGGRLAYDFLKRLNQPTGSLYFFLLGHLWMIRIFHIWSAN